MNGAVNVGREDKQVKQTLLCKLSHTSCVLIFGLSADMGGTVTS